MISCLARLFYLNILFTVLLGQPTQKQMKKNITNITRHTSQNCFIGLRELLGVLETHPEASSCTLAKRFLLGLVFLILRRKCKIITNNNDNNNIIRIMIHPYEILINILHVQTNKQTNTPYSMNSLFGESFGYLGPDFWADVWQLV